MPKPALRRIIVLLAFALLALIAKPLGYDILAQGAHAAWATSRNVVAGDVTTRCVRNCEGGTTLAQLMRNAEREVVTTTYAPSYPRDEAVSKAYAAVARFLGVLAWLNGSLWNAFAVVLVAAAALTWNANRREG